MSYSLVAHAAVSGINGGTTSSADDTGATLLVAIVTRYTGGAAVTLADSKSNTWVQVGTEQSQGVVGVSLYYVSGPTVGAGHTFTISGTGAYSSVEIQAWSGAAASPLDQQNQGSNRQPGSVTPTQDNELLVTGYAPPDSSTGVPTIDSGFTVSDGFAYGAGTNEGGAAAYLIETTATAQNPTWNQSSAGNGPAIIATFKAAAAAAALNWGYELEPQFAIRRRPQRTLASDDALWPATVVATPAQFGWDNPPQFAKRQGTRPVSKQDEPAFPVLATLTPTQQGFAWEPQFPIRRKPRLFQPDEPADQWPLTTVLTPGPLGWDDPIFYRAIRRKLAPFVGDPDLIIQTFGPAAAAALADAFMIHMGRSMGYRGI